MSRTWCNKSYDWFEQGQCINSFNQIDKNHSVGVYVNDDGDIEHHYMYHGSSIVKFNVEKKTLYVNHFGYTRGSTPQAIYEVLNMYSDRDCDVVNEDDGHNDLWFNLCDRYNIGVYGEDISSSDYWYDKHIGPMSSMVEKIPTDMKHRDFREKWFKEFAEKAELYFLGKAIGGFGWHYGIGYRFTTKHYKSRGTVIFAPCRTKLSRRVYLKQI
jgi:hypothetical protein